MPINYRMRKMDSPDAVALLQIDSFRDGPVFGLITDKDVALDSDTATGMMPIAHGVRRARVPAIVIHRQEVRPMNAVSTVGAPLQSTIARLR
jgi:hypothetical protein